MPARSTSAIHTPGGLSVSRRRCRARSGSRGEASRTDAASQSSIVSSVGSAMQRSGAPWYTDACTARNVPACATGCARTREPGERERHRRYLPPHDRTQPRGAPPPHLRHHFPPRRRQDHAHREAAALRRRDPDRRHGEGAQGVAPRDLRLDGDREAARHLGRALGDADGVPRLRHQPARHARPPGLLRGHLPRADRGRRGADGDRRGQRRRAADAAPARRSAARATRRSSPSSTRWTARCGSRSS